MTTFFRKTISAGLLKYVDFEIRSDNIFCGKEHYFSPGCDRFFYFMERSTEIYEGRNENVELYDWKA